jgi:hypothetical protein
MYMGAHMKTTIDIADSLLLQAKATAAREGTTVRQLVESGLRNVLQQRASSSPRFALRDGSFKGRGLQVGVSEGHWDELRERAYEGRGGR